LRHDWLSGQSSAAMPYEFVSDLLETRASALHGRGLFARVHIPAGTRLLEYAGERVTKEESQRRCEAGNVYIIGLDDQWDIDGNHPGNAARLINHSCAPNAEAVIEEEVTFLVREGDARPTADCSDVRTVSRIFIDTLRAISPGEEITFNYGYDLVDFHEHPCRCGAENCVGFIVAEELFPELRRTLAARGQSRR
jgi:uncharacterized protein